MIITKKSFLLSFLKSLLVFIGCIYNLYGQQNLSDSLSYYYELANNPKTANDLTTAYIFYEDRKAFNLFRKDTLDVIQDLRQIAIIQFELGLIHESEVTITEALNLLDNLTLDDSLLYEPKVGIYNHLGRVSDNLMEYENALKYYDKVLSIEKDSSRKNILINNKALAYYNQEKYELSISSFKKVYANSLKHGNKKEIARALSNLGMAKSKLKITDALDDIQNALSIREEINYDIGLFSSYIDLSEFYIDRNNKSKAKFYINKALEISETNKNIRLREHVLSALIDLNNDPFVLEYKRLTDSLNSSRLNIRNMYSSKKYAYYKQEKIANEAKIELKENQLILTRQKSKITISIAIAIFVALLSFFMFFILRVRYKKEKQKKVFETESRISKRIHDELANDVYSAMVQLENNTASIPEITGSLEVVYNKARDLSQEKFIFTTNDEFFDDLKKALSSYSNDDINIIVKGLAPEIWIDISENKKMIVLRVLKELLVNMRKHSKANLVSVIFNRKKNTVTIKYTDNGIGVYEKRVSKGVGLVNAENRIQSIGGDFIFDESAKKGLKIEIKIPV